MAAIDCAFKFLMFSLLFFNMIIKYIEDIFFFEVNTKYIS